MSDKEGELADIIYKKSGVYLTTAHKVAKALLKEGYHKPPDEGTPEYEELKEKIRDSVWDALQKWGSPPDAHYTEMIAGDVADKILSLLKGGKL